MPARPGRAGAPAGEEQPHSARPHRNPEANPALTAFPGTNHCGSGGGRWLRPRRSSGAPGGVRLQPACPAGGAGEPPPQAAERGGGAGAAPFSHTRPRGAEGIHPGAGTGRAQGRRRWRLSSALAPCEGSAHAARKPLAGPRLRGLPRACPPSRALRLSAGRQLKASRSVPGAVGAADALGSAEPRAPCQVRRGSRAEAACCVPKPPVLGGEEGPVAVQDEAGWCSHVLTPRPGSDVSKHQSSPSVIQERKLPEDQFY